MQTKYIAIVVGAIVLGAAFVWSGGQTAEHDVVLGVLLPLSGKSASIGERVQFGIQTALAELEAGGKNRFSIVIEDDRGEATPAVTAAQKLMQTDKAQLIIGTVKSDALLAVAPSTEKSKAILLSPTAGAASISQAGDYVFRLIELPDVHGKAGAGVLTGHRVTLFTAQAANARSYGDAFRAAFGVQGIVSEYEYQPDATDFRSPIAQAHARGATAYYLGVATAKDGGVLTKQIRESGFTGPIMASVAADAKEFFEAAGPAAEGTLVSAPYYDPARFSDGFTANGYDAVMLLAAAVDECNEDTSCIRDYLYSVKDYQGAGGTLSFDANGDVTKPVLIKIAKGGAFVVK